MSSSPRFFWKAVAIGAVWSLAAVPAFAGQRRAPQGSPGARGPQGREGAGAQAGRPAGPFSPPTPAPFSPPRAEGRAAPRSPMQGTPRVYAPPQVTAPGAVPPQVGQPSRNIAPPITPRVTEMYRGRAIPRPVAPPQVQVIAPRSTYPTYVHPRVYGPGHVNSRIVQVHPFYRPYYTFRPRLSLGFGLWIGYPVVYPYYYYPSAYPVPYANPYPVIPYPAPAEVAPVPGSIAPTATGGVSFDITPSDAGLYVDGVYVGIVGQFTPNDQPLGLTPGRHRIEIRANGFQPITFDVDVVAGQVIPFQGQMQPF